MTVEPMPVMQTVDWPHADAPMRRLYRRHVLYERRVNLILQPALWGLGLALWFVAGQAWLLLGAAGMTLLTLFGSLERGRQFRQVTGAVGRSTYRLEGDSIHVHNALGDEQIPLRQLERLFTYPEGVVVFYSGVVTLILPSGPVQAALQTGWHSRRPHSTGGQA